MATAGCGAGCDVLPGDVFVSNYLSNNIIKIAPGGASSVFDTTRLLGLDQRTCGHPLQERMHMHFAAIPVLRYLAAKALSLV